MAKPSSSKKSPKKLIASPNDSKKTRRSKSKNKNKDKIFKCSSKTFVAIGNNAAGLRAKEKSFEEQINKFKPGVVFIQETKFKSKGSLKFLNDYQIFEQVRIDSTGPGGGLLTAVEKCLNPVLIYEGNDELELLVVEANIENFKIRLINGYGPQEDDVRRYGFYEKLEEEII